MKHLKITVFKTLFFYFFADVWPALPSRDSMPFLVLIQVTIIIFNFKISATYSLAIFYNCKKISVRAIQMNWRAACLKYPFLEKIQNVILSLRENMDFIVVWEEIWIFSKLK
jgi:hypothetical protein